MLKLRWFVSRVLSRVVLPVWVPVSTWVRECWSDAHSYYLDRRHPTRRELYRKPVEPS